MSAIKCRRPTPALDEHRDGVMDDLDSRRRIEDIPADERTLLEALRDGTALDLHGSRLAELESAIEDIVIEQHLPAAEPHNRSVSSAGRRVT